MPENSGMDPQDINTNSRLRASDADRDHAAKVLSDALAEGLTADEHAQRLDSVYAANTQAELVPVIDDLPAKAPGASPDTAAAAPAARGGRFVAIFKRDLPEGPVAPGPGDQDHRGVRRGGPGPA